MNYHFELQLIRLKRWFDYIGIHPIVGVVIASLLFIVGAQLLFYKTSYAAYILIALGMSIILKLSDTGRNEMIHLLYGKANSRQIRAYENLIVASPFVLYLLYEAQWWMALVMLVLSVGSALMRFKQGISWAIPTPYRRLVFEYTIGFRKNLWLIILFYFVFGQSIAVQNFNLSMVSLIALSLLGMSFLMRNEHHYFIWIYTKSVRSFLLHKLKISLIAVSVLILPVVAIMLYTYTDQWFLILTAYLIGLWYQGFGILTKYSSYPRELSLVKAIVFIISLMCPPLMAILSIRYFRQSENKLIPLLS